MPSVAVLYLRDELLAPYFELLRGICDPSSLSEPHVTVRYFDRLEITEVYRTVAVDHIDVVAPGAFGLENGRSGGRKSVFMRCESDELSTLEHKPHFPSSFFHVTLYEGESMELARGLLELLSQHEWGYRVPLPAESKLDVVEVRGGNGKRSGCERSYSGAALKLYRKLTGRLLSGSELAGYTDAERLSEAECVCENLKLALQDCPRTPRSGRMEPLFYLNSSESNVGVDPHLTPPELAGSVAKYAVDLLSDGAEIHFGDPAVGTGVFYGALLGAVSQDRIASAIGIDVDEAQLSGARARWSHRGMDVHRGDYLRMDREAPRNLILANPPYLRHQDIESQDKLALRQRASIEVGVVVSGRAGLYVYFVLLAHKWMAPGCVAAWLIPSEFMQTGYGAALRYYFTTRVRLLRIHQFDPRDPQFEMVDVLPSIVVFRNSLPRDSDTVTLSCGGSLETPLLSEAAVVGELRRRDRWLLSAASPEAGVSKWTIGDLFRVRRGIATGANEFFVLERQRARALGIPECALRPVLPKIRSLSSDVIERASDGYPDVQPQYSMIDCALSEEEIERRFPGFSEYLQRGRKAGLLARTLVGRRNPWYRQEVRPPTEFLCTYMGRGGNGQRPIRFIWNKSDAVATNTYLMLYPNSLVEDRMRDDVAIQSELFGLLNDASVHTLYKTWRVHGGGLMKVEPGDLSMAPLWRAPDWIDELVQPRF